MKPVEVSGTVRIEAWQMWAVKHTPADYEQWCILRREMEKREAAMRMAWYHDKQMRAVMLDDLEDVACDETKLKKWYEGIYPLDPHAVHPGDDDGE